MRRIVEWLSFVRKHVEAPLPCLPIVDPIERTVDVYPLAGTPYDPRDLLCGVATDGEWTSGLLDRGSFVETLPDWAKTVVTGRGRLGGMPVGVIITENRARDKDILADPANMESKPVKAAQAGQVWFPDSAYKTAQAIQDFNKGEGLPLLLLANWRGFSGGRKDMFEEVPQAWPLRPTTSRPVPSRPVPSRLIARPQSVAPSFTPRRVPSRPVAGPQVWLLHR